MDDTLRAHHASRSVTVLVTHAPDLPQAVRVLLAEFGFDATFSALVGMADQTTGEQADRAHHCLWLVLSAIARDADGPTVTAPPRSGRDRSGRCVTAPPGSAAPTDRPPRR